MTVTTFLLEYIGLTAACVGLSRFYTGFQNPRYAEAMRVGLPIGLLSTRATDLLVVIHSFFGLTPYDTDKLFLFQGPLNVALWVLSVGLMILPFSLIISRLDHRPTFTRKRIPAS